MDANTPTHTWIDELTDEQCAEIFWLYVDPPDDFLARHPPRLLGAAMRYALREVVAATEQTNRESPPSR